MSAMDAVTVALKGSADGVVFELCDISSDVMSFKFADELEKIAEDAKGSFSHKYPLKLLLTLFKQNPEGSFDIGAKGILKISLNDLNLFILPQV